MTMKRFPAITLLLSLSAFSGCYPTPEPIPPIIPEVFVASVESRDVQLYQYARGKTEASDTVDIVARVEGFLQKVYFEDGQIVKQGGALFLIEQDNYKATLDSRVALLEVARAREILAEENLKRAKELFTSNTIPTEEYQTRVAEHEEAKAVVKQAQADIVLAKLKLDYTQIYAPMEGMIGEKQVSEGNLVGEGGTETVLATLRRMDPIYVYFDITDVEFNRMMQMLEKRLKEAGMIPESRSPVVADDTGDVLHTVAFRQTENTPAAPTATDDAPVAPVPADVATASDETPAPATEPSGTPAASPPDFYVPPGSTKLGGTVPTVTELPQMQADENKEILPLLQDARKLDRDIVFEMALPDGSFEKDKNYRYEGILNYVDNTIGADVAKITLRGEIPNADYRIFPGQVCFVRIPMAIRKDTVVILEEALLADLNMKYVLVVNDKNIVEKRFVELGDLVDSRHRIVESGLKPGERYVARGTQKAKVNQEVKPHSMPEDGAQRAASSPEPTE